jgi:membrane protein YdbS with pleckstrin-like domain
MDSLTPPPAGVPFTNEMVNFEAWPTIDDVVFRPIEARYFKVFLTQWLLIFIVLAALIAAFWLVDELSFHYLAESTIGAVVLFSLLFGCFWWSLKKKGFALREHDVVFRQGIIATDILIIPFNRIQHIAIHRGLLSRWFGLATFQVFTAGSHSGDLAIPGLDPTMAQQMKEVVLQYIQAEPIAENRFENE